MPSLALVLEPSRWSGQSFASNVWRGSRVMMMQAVRTERMRCSNFVSFRRYLIRRHAHRPTPGFDPKEKLTVFTWCAASDAYSQYPSAHPEPTQALCAHALGGVRAKRCQARARRLSPRSRHRPHRSCNSKPKFRMQRFRRFHARLCLQRTPRHGEHMSGRETYPTSSFVMNTRLVPVGRQEILPNSCHPCSA